MSEETPECLNVGPPLEDIFPQEYFQQVCANCSFEDGCKWAQDFYFDDEEEISGYV